MSPNSLTKPADWLPAGRSRSSLAIFSNRNLVSYYLGQLVSFTGTWVQVVALGWTVLQLTHSPLAVGSVTAIQTLPAAFLAAAAGAFIDGRRRKTILQANQVARGMVSLAFAAVIFYRLPVAFFYPLAFLAGTFDAIDTPIRQSLMYRLGGDENVADITAVNSLVFNFARVIGGPISGAILAAYGASACFLMDAGSYILLFLALCTIREPDPVPTDPKSKPDIWGRLKAAFQPIEMRLLLLALCIYSITTLNHIQIFTIYVQRSLHRGPETLGYMVAALGIGSLGSATASLWIEKKSHFGLLMSGLMLPFCFLALGLNRWPNIAIIVTGVFGFSLVQFTVRMSARIQSRASGANRGSVTGLYFMCLTGATPIGVILSGAASQYWGVTNALFACAGGATIGFLVLLSGLRH